MAYEISYEDFKSLVDTKNIQLFDVRAPKEIYKYGKIAESVNIPVNEIRIAFEMDNNEFKNKYGISKPNKDCDRLIFHCHSGKRSRMALDTAFELGYTKARHYREGFSGWDARQQSVNKC